MSTGAVKGMSKAMEAFTQMLESEQTTERPDLLMSLKEHNQLVGIDLLDELESRYAGPSDHV